MVKVIVDQVELLFVVPVIVIKSLTDNDDRLVEAADILLVLPDTVKVAPSLIVIADLKDFCPDSVVLVCAIYCYLLFFACLKSFGFWS